MPLSFVSFFSYDEHLHKANMGKAKINAYGLRGFVDCYKGSLRKPLILANGNVKRQGYHGSKTQ
jgi:hypothetical protein